MTGTPLVSCIIPIFNGEKFIAEALDSVFGQTHSPIEIIVVNDGSTDGTKAVLGGYGKRIKVIDQANAGANPARTHGIEASSGSLLAFLDADDLWLPEKTEIQVEQLTGRPKAGISTCLIENFWEQELAGEAEQLRGTKHDGPRMATMQGMMISREVFDRLGGLGSDIVHFDEIDLLLRAKADGVSIEHVDRVLVRRRIHENNISRGRGAQARADLLLLAEQAVARRRAAKANE
ncbi:MAG: glycosyltransferase family 2 protein [Alphaproteobacteria bacterium]